jgi:LytS/YehU family sensor histidine kinase
VAIIMALAVAKMSLEGREPAVPRASWVLLTLAINVLDILVVYVAWRLARRYPIGRSQPLAHLRPHALAAISYAVGLFLLNNVIAPAVDAVNWTPQNAPLKTIALNVLAYAVWASAVHGFEYVRRYRSSASAELRLQAELADAGKRRAEAEMRALKAELNPQVLGNSLDAVTSLVRTDPAAAERAIADLGDMLREAISHADTGDVTLGDEIESVAPFLAITQARFGDRLTVNWDVGEDVREARVPHMLLQPLIESALHLGRAEVNDTTIRISAIRDGPSGALLRVGVSNHNADTPASPTALAKAEAALANTRARLEGIYADRADLAIDADRGSVPCVRLALPWREEEEPERLASALPAADQPKQNVRAWHVKLFWSIWFIAFYAFAAILGYRTPTRTGHQVPLIGAFAEGFLAAAFMTALLFVPIRLTRSESLPTWRMHAIAAAAIGVLNGCNRVMLYWLIGPPYSMPPIREILVFTIQGAILYGIVAAVVHAVEYARRYRASEASRLRLRTMLADAWRSRTEAELRALKLELNPHFLGNALGAVSSLVRPHPDAAERLLAQLGETLRASIARVGTQEVTLGEEIEGLAPFLDIERARFGDRLAVVWDVDEDARGARVPHLILQPLVENAVKHGISPRGGGGRILVTGRHAGDRLELSVRDTGVGIRSAPSRRRTKHGGVGLSNTRARLEELYGSAASFDLAAAPDSGTIARLTIPWRYWS